MKEFADQGIDLTDVDKVSIGFGDANNLQAGGSGLVFFDSVRLYQGLIHNVNEKELLDFTRVTNKNATNR